MSTDLVTSVLVDALRVAVLLAISAPIAWLLARGPARARSWLWLAVLAGALLTPVLARLMSPTDIVVPGWVAHVSGDAAVHGGVGLGDRERRDAPPRESGPPTLSAVTGEAVVPPAKRQVWFYVPPGIAMVWVWGLGVVGLMLRTVAGYWRIARIVARATAVVDPEWTAALRRAARRVGCRRTIRLMRTDELDVPATTGVLRPTVLLPVAADRWLIDRREVVLMHEVVHIRRLDWAARIVARIVTALHWFDPLAWWASSRLGREQERACDEAVLGAGVRASTYAAHLLDIARAARPRPALSVPALELTRRTEVEERIMHVLDTRMWRRSAALFGLPVIVVVGSLVPAIASVRPAPQEPQAVVESPPLAAAAPAAPTAPDDERPSAVAQVPSAAHVPSPEPPPAPPADAELSRLIRDMDRLESEIRAPLDEIDETVRLRLEEKLREVESLRVEIDEQRMAEIEARIEAELAGVQDLEIDLQPIRAEIEEVAKVIEALELDAVLDEQALREAIEPHLERMSQLHAELEPVHERMAEVHSALEPLNREMEAVHEQMEERHLEMERLQSELEPLHQEVERLHESLEPMQAELERTAEQIDRAVTREVESAIRSGMASVVAPGAPFDEAARRVVAASHVWIHDGMLSVNGPADEIRTILGDLMRAHRRSGTDFESALDATAGELTPLRRSVDLD